MPLEAGAKEGTPGFGRNVATEIKAGKDPKQAEAIAYSKARGDEDAKLDAIAARADAISGKRLRSLFAKEAEAKAYARRKGVDSKPFLDRPGDENSRWVVEHFEASRADALQPNPWANKIAALGGGVDSLTARIAARADVSEVPYKTVLKKCHDGDWEAMSDIKPGRVLEIIEHNKNGKPRKMIQVGREK